MTCIFKDSFESRMNPRFPAESEKGVLWEPGVIESGRETVVGFKEDEKGKRRASVLSSFRFWSCVSSAKSWWFTEWLAMLSEKGVVYRTKRMGPLYWDLRHTVHELWWWRRRVIDWSGLISVWELWLRPLERSRLNAKNRVQAGKENLVVNSVKSCWKTECVWWPYCYRNVSSFFFSFF